MTTALARGLDDDVLEALATEKDACPLLAGVFTGVFARSLRCRLGAGSERSRSSKSSEAGRGRVVEMRGAEGVKGLAWAAGGGGRGREGVGGR